MAEHWRIDAFKLWCWRRLLRVPWTARRSKQSILKEISPGCSLEGLMLKLKLQSLATWCEELTHWKRPWFWERLKAGGEGDYRGWDGWMASPTRWTWVWVNPGSGDGQGGLACCNSWGHKESDTTERLNRMKMKLKFRSLVVRVTFQVLHSHVWQAATILDGTGEMFPLSGCCTVWTPSKDWIRASFYFPKACTDQVHCLAPQLIRQVPS